MMVENGIDDSMSALECPYENSCAESFFCYAQKIDISEKICYNRIVKDGYVP